MDLLNEYSSDSGSENDTEVKVDKKIDELIPRQIILKKRNIGNRDRTENNKNNEKEVELAKIKLNEDEENNIGLGDIFNLDNLKKRKIKLDDEGVNKVMKKVIDDRLEIQQDEEIPIKYVKETKKSRKINNTIQNANEISELNMNKMYERNKLMIDEGEIDLQEQLNKGKIKYYQQGNNNLKNIIKFNELNKDRIDYNINKDKDKTKTKNNNKDNYK